MNKKVKAGKKTSTKEVRVVKYHTHRGIYTAIVKEGNKFAKFVTIDEFPIRLQRTPITVDRGRSELFYMDDMKEYPIIKAVKTMIYIGNVRGINKNASEFLESIAKELKFDTNTINKEDMKHGD